MSESQASSRNPRIAVALILLVALIAGAWLLLRAPVQAPPPPAPVVVEEPVEEPEAIELQLMHVEGDVEVRSPDGAWRAAQAGEQLEPADSVRTGAEGRAVMGSSAAYEVQLDPGTHISVEALTHSISRLLLERGMATANVREQRHVFEVAAAGSDAVARSDDGSFTVSNDGTGTVAVASHRGEVELSGAGRLVVVRAGQQSLVLAGKAPTEPAPIPESLLLKVQWPQQGTLRRRRLVVAGESDPGTRIEIDGEPITVGADGRFASEIELREGRNPLRVRARGVGGQERELEHEVQVDTTAPKVGLDRDLWGD